MKQYLGHSLAALSLLTLAVFLIHVNNSSSVAHANLHVDTPIPPLTQLADSLRTVSVGLDGKIVALRTEESALRGSLALPVVSEELCELSQPAPADEAISTEHPDAFQLNTRIEQQIACINRLDTLVEIQRGMVAHFPILTPCNGVHTSGFGVRVHPITHVLKGHTGMDIATKTGTPIHASGDGIVVFAGVKHGYGNVVEIDHGYGYHTLYGHSSKLLVQAGDTIARGQTIALVGSTGASTGPHLHYEVIVDGTKIDPSPFLIAPLDEATPTPAIAFASAQSGTLTALRLLATR